MLTSRHKALVGKLTRMKPSIQAEVRTALKVTQLPRPSFSLYGMSPWVDPHSRDRICRSWSVPSHPAGRLPTHCSMKEMNDGTFTTQMALLSRGMEDEGKHISRHSKIIPTGVWTCQTACQTQTLCLQAALRVHVSKSLPLLTLPICKPNKDGLL